MRKLTSIVLATVVCISMSGCRATNIGRGNTNDGTNIGGTAGLNNINANTNYRDGRYTSSGDVHDGMNESATVEIKGGKITHVDLNRIAQQTGTANNQAGTGIGGTLGNISGMGTNNQGPSDTQSGVGIGGSVGNAAGAGTNTVDRTGIGGSVGNAAGTGTYNQAGTGVSGNVGNAAGNTGDTLEQAKGNIMNAVIQNQSENINVTSSDASVRAAIGNWKLAISRALDLAR